MANSPNLASLSLYWNLKVTDRTLQTLAERAETRLHTLNLSGCKRITDKGVRALAANCPTLANIDFTRHAQFLQSGFIAIHQLEVLACVVS